jgi:hypothetical protein
MMHRYVTILLLVIFATGEPAFSQEDRMAAEKHGNVLFSEDFSQDLHNWWIEGGGQVWIHDGRLYVKAVGSKRSHMNVSTVWCRSMFPGDVRIEFDAHVISSPNNVNNINIFISYSDPSGAPLFESRQERRTGAYPLYHQLNGYIVTYLNDAENRSGSISDNPSDARFRLRRCPGFRLIQETYAYHCKKGVTYHIAFTKRGNRLTYSVDGTVYLDAKDGKPLAGGLFGLRTYSTFLWWDNIKVYKAD